MAPCGPLYFRQRTPRRPGPEAPHTPPVPARGVIKSRAPTGALSLAHPVTETPLERLPAASIFNSRPGAAPTGAQIAVAGRNPQPKVSTGGCPLARIKRTEGSHRVKGHPPVETEPRTTLPQQTTMTTPATTADQVPFGLGRLCTSYVVHVEPGTHRRILLPSISNRQPETEAVMRRSISRIWAIALLSACASTGQLSMP